MTCSYPGAHNENGGAMEVVGDGVGEGEGEGEGEVVMDVMGESRTGVGLCDGGQRCYKATKLSRRS